VSWFHCVVLGSRTAGGCGRSRPPSRSPIRMEIGSCPGQMRNDLSELLVLVQATLTNRSAATTCERPCDLAVGVGGEALRSADTSRNFASQTVAWCDDPAAVGSLPKNFSVSLFVWRSCDFAIESSSNWTAVHVVARSSSAIETRRRFRATRAARRSIFRTQTQARFPRAAFDVLILEKTESIRYNNAQRRE